MKDPIEQLGFRLSLGVQEVDRILTPEELATIRRIAVAYVRRKNQDSTGNEAGEQDE